MPIEELIKRLENNRQRPLIFKKNFKDTVKKIYFERKKFYNEADYRIKCNSLKSKEIAYKIAKRQSFLDCAISQVETRLRG